MKNLTWLAGLCLLACTTAASAAQPVAAANAAPEAVDPAVVVEELALLLEANFVSPETGRLYAFRLRERAAAGAYAAGTPEEIAERVTTDLQAVHKDGHLRLFAPKRAGVKPKYRTEPSADGAIGKSGWLADGVAYIELTMFPSDPKTLAAIGSFLDAHASAKSVIVDIRKHHGGDIGEIDVLASYLYGAPVVLAQMDTRQAVDEAGLGPFSDGPTLRRVAGPDGVVRREHFVTPAAQSTGLRSAKLFLLTSKRTVSAGEHLAMVLKRTDRATLVGETTSGAGNFGNQYKLPGGYSAFIPVGRSFNPDTGEGWEGVGIAPDVAVPADQALDDALKLAGVKVSGDSALASLR